MNEQKSKIANVVESSQSYDARTIALHWITAALVVLLWVIAHYIDDFPKGPARINMRSTHILFGVLLSVVLVYRIYWRTRRGRSLPPINSGALAAVTKAGHMALYTLLIATVLLGVTNAWIRGDSFFNQWTIPSLAPGNKALRKQVGDLHELAANTILIVAGIHALIALIHHFVLRDLTLRRMIPRRTA
ncbi:MAG TPA: cytochrome b [Steroidobacteraceae bacterium]|nr:cytochrome b [Steroidobacteraceae bacterium]